MNGLDEEGPLDGVRDCPAGCFAAVLTSESRAALVDELHEAAARARQAGYRLMGRHLDECGFALSGDCAADANGLGASIERARASLETWRALRDW